MLDHFTLRVRDYDKAKAFYAAALAPLGYLPAGEYQGYAGFGVKGKPDLWLTADPEARPQHFAFTAKDRKTVDAFYAAALAAGGRDNGPPGVRKDYHPSYYAAFVLDPDGHNAEAVCHLPPRPARRAIARKPKPRKARAGKRRR